MSIKDAIGWIRFFWTMGAPQKQCKHANEESCPPEDWAKCKQWGSCPVRLRQEREKYKPQNSMYGKREPIMPNVGSCSGEISCMTLILANCPTPLCPSCAALRT